MYQRRAPASKNINLAVTLQRADEHVREWVAHNALPHGRVAPPQRVAQLIAEGHTQG
jgi:hypothetical protein